MKRLLDHDPVTGVTEYFYYDDATDRVHIETVADAGPVIEANKRQYNEKQASKDWIKVASIPPAVQMLWLEKYGVNLFNRNHDERVKRLLNDPEWRYLRTAPGVL